MDKNSFTTLGPGPSFIKLFTAAVYNKLERLPVEGLVDPSLIFARKAEGNLSEAPFRLYQQIVD